jgi:hypothetical protein
LEPATELDNKQGEVLFNIAEIFNGMTPLPDEEPEGRYLDGSPWLVRPLEESGDILRADISDHFGQAAKE